MGDADLVGVGVAESPVASAKVYALNFIAPTCGVAEVTNHLLLLSLVTW
jgi:hypothetical protein